MLILILALCLALFSACAPAPKSPPEAARQKNTLPPQNPVFITPSPDIGRFSTKILDKAPERLNNLRLAAREINGAVINPGEEFSFNEALGRRTKEKGYEKARIIINGKKGYGIGGGICQVSSTLNAAVKAAGLLVTEKHEHEKPVGYIAREDEAAVSFGGLDFKFINTLEYKISINVEITQDEVIVALKKAGI